MTKKKIARTKRGTKKATRDTAPRVEKPVNQEIQRAAERAGIASPDPYKDAMRHVTNRVGDLLATACDQLGQEIAEIEQSGGGDNTNVVRALLTMWSIRWELGLFPDQVDVTAKVPEKVIAEEVETLMRRQAERAAGGAS